MDGSTGGSGLEDSFGSHSQSVDFTEAFSSSRCLAALFRSATWVVTRSTLCKERSTAAFAASTKPRPAGCASRTSSTPSSSKASKSCLRSLPPESNGRQRIGGESSSASMCPMSTLRAATWPGQLKSTTSITSARRIKASGSEIHGSSCSSMPAENDVHTVWKSPGGSSPAAETKRTSPPAALTKSLTSRPARHASSKSCADVMLRQAPSPVRH
mmetsp:Transcript_4762/g.8433  ORF Transcript_4762/g.8433 Transcript_4762/m.8433 type:complete len:214 (-) Transcript_4762:17-658(-)